MSVCHDLFAKSHRIDSSPLFGSSPSSSVIMDEEEKITIARDVMFIFLYLSPLLLVRFLFIFLFISRRRNGSKKEEKDFSFLYLWKRGGQSILLPQDDDSATPSIMYAERSVGRSRHSTKPTSHSRKEDAWTTAQKPSDTFL